MFAIQRSFDNYQTHQSIALVKRNGMVKAPQLFTNKKPVLYYSLSLSGTPKVTSQKWVCYRADPTQAIYQHNVNEYDLGGYNDMNLIFPGISRSKKTDCSSGLTVAIKGIKTSSDSRLGEASLRITRSSISTNYINVFSWAWYSDNRVGAPGLPFAQFSDDADYMTANRGVSPRYEQVTESGLGLGAGSGYIDGVRWRMVQRWLTIPKGSSGTYLYVASPWADIRNTYPNPTVTGWGIILEPTNSNTYPM